MWHDKITQKNKYQMPAFGKKKISGSVELYLDKGTEGTVIQIEKTLINNLLVKFAIFLKSILLLTVSIVFSVYK